MTSTGARGASLGTPVWRTLIHGYLQSENGGGWRCGTAASKSLEAAAGSESTYLIGKMGFHASCTYFNYFVPPGNNLRARSSVSLLRPGVERERERERVERFVSAFAAGRGSSRVGGHVRLLRPQIETNRRMRGESSEYRLSRN